MTVSECLFLAASIDDFSALLERREKRNKRTHTYAHVHASIHCTACSQLANDSETYALNDKIVRRHAEIRQIAHANVDVDWRML